MPDWREWMEDARSLLLGGLLKVFDSPDTRSPAPRHEVCRYGTKCRYRHGCDDSAQQHLARFAHPFDGEYEVLCARRGMRQEARTLRSLFRWLDSDDSGKITVEELMAGLDILRRLDPSLKFRAEHLKDIDEDGNGVLNFSEFSSWAGPRLGLDLGVQIKSHACHSYGCMCEHFRPRRRRTTLSHQALDICGCGHKASMHASRTGDSVDIPCPKYWKNAGGTYHFNELVPVADLSTYQQLLNSTYASIETRDRKKHNPGETALPRGYQVTRVLRVENNKDWRGYSVKKLNLMLDRRDLRPCAARSSEEWCRLTGVPLAKEVNEWYLFHGTHVEAAAAIAQTDFKMSMAGSHAGTLYGRGTYFAESITKADEYSKMSATGEYCVLFCRCLGGQVLYTDEERPDTERLVQGCIAGPYNCVLGDREKCRGTYREFVFFDGEDIYPEYIIYYKRVY